MTFILFWLATLKVFAILALGTVWFLALIASIIFPIYYWKESRWLERIVISMLGIAGCSANIALLAWIKYNVDVTAWIRGDYLWCWP